LENRIFLKDTYITTLKTHLYNGESLDDHG
jgi:hypothetical protein